MLGVGSPLPPFLWVLNKEFRLPGLFTKLLYWLGHLTSSHVAFMMLVYLTVLSRDHQAFYAKPEHLKITCGGPSPLPQQTCRCRQPFGSGGSWVWSQDSHSLSRQRSHDQRKGGAAALREEL